MSVGKKIINIVSGNNQSQNQVVPGQRGWHEDVGHINQGQPKADDDMDNVKGAHHLLSPPFMAGDHSPAKSLVMHHALKKGLDKGEEVAGKKKKDHNEPDEPDSVLDRRISQAHELAFINFVHILSPRADLPLVCKMRSFLYPSGDKSCSVSKKYIRKTKGGKKVAKRHNRERQQKRNVDKSGQEKFRTEVARELSEKLPEKEKKSVPKGNTSTYKVDDEEKLS